MIACGSSERGLSEVTIVQSLSSHGDAAHQRALGAVAVAAAAEHGDHAARLAAAARSPASAASASGLCA